MPSIAEKLAARRKAEAVVDKPAAVSIKERREQEELEAVIDRIDPPGKREAAQAARAAATRLILKAEPPPKPEIRVPVEPDPRSLGETDGETIDLTPLNASQSQAAWHAAFNAFESDLCLVTDPKDGQRAWIAVRLLGQEDWPILLKSLPLYEHPRTVREGPF